MPIPALGFTSEKLEGAGAQQLSVGVQLRVPCLSCSGPLRSNGTSQAALLYLPVFLLITGEHLSVDKTLLWDDSNHRKYNREGAKPR